MPTGCWYAQGMDGMVAGEIAAALDVPPTNLSFHLKAMTQAGLVTVEQQGRFQRYRANLPLMRELIGYLTDECCAGHPEQCADLGAPSSAPGARGSSDSRKPKQALKP